MKKTALLMAALMVTVLASTAAMAGQGGNLKPGMEIKAGTLFLFQKCDVSLHETYPDEYDASGCPTADGPWPILPGNRWGQMKYNLLGETFRFAFEAKKLAPNTEYTLIYYPDPWPGNNLICLGSRKAGRAGNLQLNGSKEILNSEGELSGLPTSDDANFSATCSGAVGAKIWLVRSEDVECEVTTQVVDESEVAVPPHMTGWNPEDYLFEGNLIVYQYLERPTKQ